MFTRWGRFVYRRRRLMAILPALLALASLTLAPHAAEELSSGGWIDRDSESSRVADRLSQEFGAGRSSIIVLYRTQGADASSEPVQGAIADTLAPLRTDARVARIVGYAETGDPRFISADRAATYVVIDLHATEEGSVVLVEEFRSAIRPGPGLTFQLTGYGPLELDATRQSEKDLQLAETVSLPFALLILLIVFGSLVAAAMPLLVAGLAIPTTMAAIYLLAQRTEMSIYVLNVASMLGLALAIDYSLFLVSRFKEELGRGRSVEASVERAVATSGKAVVFSGLAVAVGLLGLLFFENSGLSSIGVAGALVVASCVLFAMTFLPAVLGMLGHRVDALSVGGLVAAARRRPRPGSRTAQVPAAEVPAAPAAGGASAARDGGRWGSVARWVMAHPYRVLVPTLIFLIVAGLPFLRLVPASGDAALFPAGLESRDAYVALTREFDAGQTTPLTILADVTGDPTSPENARALAEYAGRVAALDGIDRVESPFSYDPRSRQQLDPGTVAAVYSLPPDQRPPDLARYLGAYVRGSTVRMDAISSLPPNRVQSGDLVPSLRRLDPGAGIRAQIGGIAAGGHDVIASMAARIPLAVGATLLVSAVVLFLLFGSVVLPVKAVIMTLLSITASFGALVWIFQEGNLATLLDFEPLGYTVVGTPIIMFSVIFGLSMDYEVLLLSRIQEAYRRTGDNTASVAEGLARTAGVITGAALIMVVVFAAFALAQIVTIKSIGVGMAIAVLLDATVIRVLLVPATMRLMGHYNWWAPGPLGRLAERLGFSHVETEDGDGRAPEREPVPA